MSKLSVKLAAAKPGMSLEDSEALHDRRKQLKERAALLIEELNGLITPVFPSMLEEYDEEIADEFVTELQDTVDFLKGEGKYAAKPKKQKTPKERKPLKRPNLRKLGTSVKNGISRIP